MLDALKRSNFVIKTVNSSYGHFMYDNEKYFFKIVDKNDFIKEINGYLEVCDKLKVKKLVNILTDNEKYYLIYEYEKTIIKNKGLIHDLFVYYEYYNISYDKNIFINLINNFRRRYRNLKILSYSKNDEFFEGSIKNKLLKWYINDLNFDKAVEINYKESTTTNNIINETIKYFNNLENKLCLISSGNPNTLNLSTNSMNFDLKTAGYNNIYGEVAITYISYLIFDAYFSPKYNKNSYLNHNLIYKYIKKFKPKLKYKNTNKIIINSNIVTSSIRKKYIKDYLLMLKEENVPINEEIKYYLIMRLLCVFNINKINLIDYYYILYLIHFIYNYIQEDAINSLIDFLDCMEEI